MANTKNPRRALLPVLKAMTNNIKVMVSTWGSVIATQTLDPETRSWRKRTESELPENNSEEWDQLIKYMVAVRNQADSVIAYATEQRNRLTS